METKKCLVCRADFTPKNRKQKLCGKVACRRARMNATSAAYAKAHYAHYQELWAKKRKQKPTLRIDPKAPFFRCYNCAFYMRRGEKKCLRCGWQI